MSENSRLSQWVPVAVGLGGLYLLYRLFTGVKNAATQVLSPVIGPVVSAIYNAIQWAEGNTVTPTGRIVLPNGDTVNVSDVGGLTFNDAANVAQFAYNSVQYVILPNPSGGPAYDQAGNYHAITLADFNTSGLAPNKAGFS